MSCSSRYERTATPQAPESRRMKVGWHELLPTGYRIGKVTCESGRSAAPISVMEMSPARWLSWAGPAGFRALPASLPDPSPRRAAAACRGNLDLVNFGQVARVHARRPAAYLFAALSRDAMSSCAVHNIEAALS